MNKDFITKYKIAHRGGFYDNIKIPENSLSAFEIAASKGYAIELDVQLLAGGGVAVFHHPTLDMERLLNKKGEDLRIFTAEQLKDCKLIGSGEPVPTLEQVLTLINKRVPIFIEIKTKGSPVKLCEQVYNAVKNYDGDFIVMSFDYKVLKWFYRHAPQIIRGILVSPWPKSDIYRPKSSVVRFATRNMWFVKAYKPDFISYNSEFLPSKVVNKKYPGLPLVCWTIRTPEQFKQIAPYVNNITFEHFIPDPKIKMGDKR